MIIKQIFSNVIYFIVDALRKTHKEGYIFVAISFCVMILGFACWNFIGWLGFIFTIYCIYFFRNPTRIAPADVNVMVAPADGIVTAIESASLPSEIGEDGSFTRVSIFLSVFDCHVNRIPFAGKILKACYVPGKFLSATLDKSSVENERNILYIQSNSGVKYALVQIAGLIARRIVSYAQENDEYKTGESYGIIRFGSRVDLYVPHGFDITIQKGQTMLGGETIIAKSN